MGASFWLGLILLIGGILLYVMPAYAYSWWWIVVAVIGAIIAIVGINSCSVKKKK